jgi:hypothetical protein
MRPTLTPLPLIFDGDSFIIDMEAVGLKCVRILRIIRYPHNQNTTGVEEHFHDLTPDAKRAIIRQINRRHVGKSVII